MQQLVQQRRTTALDDAQMERLDAWMRAVIHTPANISRGMGADERLVSIDHATHYCDGACGL